ncbi:hypothetical protein [Adlercreutzia sp. ZJ304]|uniref:hypothetical protein n=1 Tax=Adlercreutzia sp. ZJ304 TaxID=2709791 RepID=UPI0013ECE52B|nr:hypothetical protein [Adlercreutzia sp. ZJ304]
MGLNPAWNGDVPTHHNQYELMAQSLIQGHLYLDLPVDPVLAQLNNPYDPVARNDSGASFFWDHAFYDGRYYMYFGIVPVLVLFLPYQLITGHSLTTYHATQLFVALFIVGLFSLFWRMRKIYFKQMPFVSFLILCVAFSLMSVWYGVGSPALYCTAISSALCSEVWSLYLFAQAMGMEFGSRLDIRRRIFLVLASLLGAMAFGCRPPIALANLVVIPLLVSLFRMRDTRNFIIDATAIIAPYVIVGALLMGYNFLRFESPFEFGQSYQLTVADQSGYGEGGRSFSSSLQEFSKFFFELPGESTTFAGVFINYPMLFISFFSLAYPRVRVMLRERRLLTYLFTMIVAIILIGLFDSVWSPYILERYRMDVYWLLGIISFVLYGFWGESVKNQVFYVALSVLGVITAVTSVLLFLVPYDSNLASLYPDSAKTLRQYISLGIWK